MTPVMQPHACANPNCRRPLPPAQPGHKARLTCGARCRKAASRLRKQEEARRQEEAARRARQERWPAFLPATRRSLERLEALAGARLAEELAEAIRCELVQAHVTADLAMEAVTVALGHSSALRERGRARLATWRPPPGKCMHAHTKGVPEKWYHLGGDPATHALHIRAVTVADAGHAWRERITNPRHT